MTHDDAVSLILILYSFFRRGFNGLGGFFIWLIKIKSASSVSSASEK